MNPDKIYPGKIMLDSEGERIQAHAGGIFYENGTYYWYGENKEKTTGKTRVWTWGIRCYSSQDFYNWKDEGLIIQPEPDNKRSWLHPSKQIDRPHIIYSIQSKKYICWLKYSGKKEACFCVLSADRLLGPYKMERTCMRPFGRPVGDFDIYQDPLDGRAYLYFASGHEGVIACELTSDYMDVTAPYRTYYTGRTMPYCREGIAMVRSAGDLYMITSGMTGYIPNPTEAARLSSPLGELEPLGNPHQNDRSGASFCSQISAIFQHPEKPGIYVALADRWIPSLHMTEEKTEKMMRTLASCVDKKYRSTLLEKVRLGFFPWDCTRVNTSVSDYVWLPLRFEGNRPVIRWEEQWEW